LIPTGGKIERHCSNIFGQEIFKMVEFAACDNDNVVCVLGSKPQHLQICCYSLSMLKLQQMTTSSGLVAKLTTWQSGLEVRITVVFLSA
jgi:hypothetical protein